MYILAYFLNSSNQFLKFERLSVHRQCHDVRVKRYFGPMIPTDYYALCAQAILKNPFPPITKFCILFFLHWFELFKYKHICHKFLPIITFSGNCYGIYHFLAYLHFHKKKMTITVITM